METPPTRPDGDGPVPGPAEQPREPAAVPTEQDRENERVRRAVAQRMEAEYTACLALALQAFGPGWEPSHRHYLVDKDEEDRARRTGERPTAAATVYTVKNAAGERRHFTVTEDGRVTEQESHEAGFGAMLLEPHPTRIIVVRGQSVHPHRYSLCWAGYELYHPMSAERLAALRATRERKKEERLDEEFARENPLLARAGIRRQDLE